MSIVELVYVHGCVERGFLVLGHVNELVCKQDVCVEGCGVGSLRGGGERAGHAEGVCVLLEAVLILATAGLTLSDLGQDFRAGEARADRGCGDRSDGGAGPQAVLGLWPRPHPRVAVLVSEGRVVVGVHAHTVCILHEVPLAAHLTGHTQRGLTGSLLLLIVTDTEKEGGRNKGRE